MNFLRKVADGLVSLSAVIGGIALLVLTLTILIDVIGRAVGFPLYGARDVVKMAAVVAVFSGMAFAEKRGGHISVDILEGRFSPDFNRWLVTFGLVVGAVLFAVIAWRFYVAAPTSMMLKKSTNILFIKRWPFDYGVMALCAITAFYMGLRAITRIAGGRDEP